MDHFGKHLLRCMIWLLLSEILCLVLAVSAAILGQKLPAQVLGLICGIAAHILLTASCAQKCAKEDAGLYRSAGKRISPCKVILIAVCALIPSELTYLLLCMNRESILMLNLFPLLNAPFLQFYRLMIQNTEPFFAIPAGRRLCMALPPLATSAAWFCGYYLSYIPALAKTDAGKKLS
ncbi:MAG: hypothetical protein IKQ91_00515 [Oscillospiraceae bacterium]|nr:hypothetical protein [Oscillospiraceae bacterium]